MWGHFNVQSVWTEEEKGKPPGESKPAQECGQLGLLEGTAAVPQRPLQLAQGHRAAAARVQLGQRLPDVFTVVLQLLPGREHRSGAHREASTASGEGFTPPL